MFNIQFTLRFKDNKDNKTRKGNKANNGVYGPKDAKYKVDLGRIDNHYIIYKMFPCSSFFIKNYLEIIKGNPIKDEADFLNRCQIYERRANGAWKRNVSKAHISSLNLVDELDKAGAFEPLYRNDRDVDLACVHEWVDKDDNNNELTIEDYNIKKLEDDKKANKKAINIDLIYYADFETYTKGNQEIKCIYWIQLC